MLKNLKVTTKLVAILVAPVLVLVALAFVGVSQRQGDAREAERVLALTDFVGATTSLLKEVEREALLAARYSGSQGDAEIGTLYAAQQQKTAAAAEEYQNQVKEIDPGRDDPDVRTAISNVTDRLGTLSGMGQTVNGRTTDGLTVNDLYQNLADELTDTIHEIAASLDDPDLFLRMSSVSGVAQLGAARMKAASILAIAMETT